MLIRHMLKAPRSRYLWLAAIPLTAGSGFSSPPVSRSPPPPFTHSSASFNSHLALRGVLKQGRGARPSPPRRRLISSRSLPRASPSEQKLTADGCAGSWQGVTGVWPRVDGSLRWREGLSQRAPHTNSLIQGGRGIAFGSGGGGTPRRGWRTRPEGGGGRLFFFFLPAVPLWVILLL